MLPTWHAPNSKGEGEAGRDRVAVKLLVLLLPLWILRQPKLWRRRHQSWQRWCQSWQAQSVRARLDGSTRKATGTTEAAGHGGEGGEQGSSRSSGTTCFTLLHTPKTVSKFNFRIKMRREMRRQQLLPLSPSFCHPFLSLSPSGLLLLVTFASSSTRLASV